MTLSLNNLTFIIVTFKSDHIINECIKSLPKDSNIIIIESIFITRNQVRNIQIKTLHKLYYIKEKRI